MDKTITTVTSKITYQDHQNKHSNDKKFEILQDLQKYDKEPWNKQNAVGKMTCSVPVTFNW